MSAFNLSKIFQSWHVGVIVWAENSSNCLKQSPVTTTTVYIYCYCYLLLLIILLLLFYCKAVRGYNNHVPCSKTSVSFMAIYTTR